MIMAKEKTTMWTTCRVCKNQVEMQVHVEDVTAWENGELIQNAMPYLTPDEREILISGTCGPCFDGMFGSEEEKIILPALRKFRKITGY